MILQELYRLAEHKGLMEDPDYEWRPVAWLVRISRDGRIIGIEDTRSVPPETAPESGRKARPPKPIAKNFRLPREKAVTSGDRAFLLYGKAEYVFGIDPEEKRGAAKLTARFNLFRNRVSECAEATRDEGVICLLKAIDAYSVDKTCTMLSEEEVMLTNGY